MDEYFDLKNSGYMGEEMFIRCKIGQWELALNVNHAIMQAYKIVLGCKQSAT